MGPGFGDGIGQALRAGAVFMLIVGALGFYGCQRGCKYINDHYEYGIKRKP